MKNNNKFIQTSGILLVLTLMSSCFVGETFAKYVSELEANDEARVAKWGVELSTDDESDEAFKINYGKHDSNSEFNGSITVTSSELEKKIIAPGTQGVFSGITVDGKPEVAVEINTNATVDLGENDNWTVTDSSGNPIVYCPLIFKIGNTIIDGLSYTGYNTRTTGGINTFEQKIKEAIDSTNNYAANTQLNEIVGGYEWAWLFDSEDSKKTWADNYKIERALGADDQDDELDTLLANKIASYEDNKPTINIEITTTVTQID